MTENERELLRIIHGAEDPAKAMKAFMDIGARCIAGESMESIAASYGLVQTATGFVKV